MDTEAGVRRSPPFDEQHLAELSNVMVRLYKDLFGRGPTKARTNYAGADVIVTTLENTLTRPEQKMVEEGEHERVRDLRMHFQYMREAEFVEAVELITGRKVHAFVSGINTSHDLSTELFYLEPRERPAASDGRLDGHRMNASST